MKKRLKILITITAIVVFAVCLVTAAGCTDNDARSQQTGVPGDDAQQLIDEIGGTMDGLDGLFDDFEDDTFLDVD